MARLSILVPLVGFGFGVGAAEVGEAATKASFLARFGLFVEWPNAQLANDADPLNLCLVGLDPFGATLDRAVAGQHVGSHPIQLHRIGAVAPEHNCHIAYFGGAEGRGAAAAGRGVLTVTDGVAESGEAGMINFVTGDNKVRFVIDDAAAAAGGLAISSRLLDLAVYVKRRN